MPKSQASFSDAEGSTFSNEILSILLRRNLVNFKKRKENSYFYSIVGGTIVLPIILIGYFLGFVELSQQAF